MHYKNDSAAHTINEQWVFVKNDKPVTTSRLIAKTFQKNHQHVLRDIRNLGCSEEFGLSNFGQSSYLNTQGKSQPEFQITKDGFVLLVMGYVGENAMQFKESYIKRFNEMEAQLQKSMQASQSLLSSYNSVQLLINQCYAVKEGEHVWYAASQLRRLSGKSSTGGYQRKAKELHLVGKVKQIFYRGQQCWFVRKDAVQDILCVRQNHLTAVAMVNILQMAQATQIQIPFVTNLKGGTHV
jgi:Rha family phage regulatory protein